MTPVNDNFIMLPTVDFCFKELMQNDKVRKGFIAALLNESPEDIRETSLLPTSLKQEFEDDKLGVLDVAVVLRDGTQLDLEMQVLSFAFWTNRILFYLSRMFAGQLKKGEPYEKLKKCIHVSILDFIHFPDDKRCYHKIAFCDTKTGTTYTDLMELHILELKKLPEKALNEEGIIRWMRFFNGKNKEEFKEMAKTDPYIEEAYSELEKLSADERKRLEYEAREKAVRDYNSLMGTQLRLGFEKGMEQGKLEGIRQGLQEGLQEGLQQGLQQGMDNKLLDQIRKKLAKGKSYAQIADELEEDVSTIEQFCTSIRQTSENN